MSLDSYIPLRKTREFSDVLSVTFQFLRVNFKKLGTTLVYTIAVPAVLGAIGSAFFQKVFLSFYDPNLAAERLLDNLPQIFAAYGVFAFLGLVTLLLSSLVVYSYLYRYQENSGNEFETSEVWSMARRFAVRYVGMSLLMTLMSVVMFIIVLIPCLGLIVWGVLMIYLMPAWSIAFPAMMVEDLGILDAIRRGSDLVKERRWETIGVYFLAVLIAGVLGAVFSMPTYIISMYASIHMIQGGTIGNTLQMLMFIGTALSSLGGTFMLCIPLVATGIQYFNLVEKVDRTGLMERMKAMEAANWAAGHRSLESTAASAPVNDPGFSPDVPVDPDKTAGV